MKQKIITLYAPLGYRKLTKEEKKTICNGCGAKGGITVPSTFYGLDISAACDIHDYMYYAGKTNADKEAADRIFLNNLNRIIEARSCCILKYLRQSRAKKYYKGVKYFGSSAFWEGKNKASEVVLLT